MDELEISGKRYISAKRIAKENKYHSDYIGQLIRGGKIVGTKVGRAWYVEEDSFARYLRGGETVYSAQSSTPPQNPPQQPSDSAMASHPGSASGISTAVPISTFPQMSQEPQPRREEVGVPTEASGQYPVAQANSSVIFPAVAPSAPHIPLHHISVPQEIEQAPAVKKPTLTYIADTSPLFPEIPKRASVPPAGVLPQLQKEAPALTEYIETPKPARSLFKTTLGIGALGAVSAVFFILAFFGSVGFNSTVIVEKGKPASVRLSQEGTFCFIFKTCQKE